MPNTNGKGATVSWRQMPQTTIDGLQRTDRDGSGMQERNPKPSTEQGLIWAVRPAYQWASSKPVLRTRGHGKCAHLRRESSRDCVARSWSSGSISTLMLPSAIGNAATGTARTTLVGRLKRVSATTLQAACYTMAYTACWHGIGGLQRGQYAGHAISKLTLRAPGNSMIMVSQAISRTELRPFRQGACTPQQTGAAAHDVCRRHPTAVTS